MVSMTNPVTGQVVEAEPRDSQMWVLAGYVPTPAPEPTPKPVKRSPRKKRASS